MTEAKTIFLSHSSRDIHVAEAIGDWLKQVFKGIEVFVSSIEPGKDFHAEIMKTLRKCKLGVILVTENSSERIWVNFEVGILLALNKPIIPLCAGGIDKTRLPSTFQTHQACRYENEGERLQMVDTIARILGIQLISKKASMSPIITVLPPTIGRTRYFDQRKDEQLEKLIIQIIKSAADSKKELCVAGIANTNFFGSDPTFNNELRSALDQGLRARFIFLDPKSQNAFRREIYELKRLDTRHVISSSIQTATDLRNEYNNNALRIRLAQEVPSFLCFNHEDMIIQPYFISETGHRTQTWRVPIGTQPYKIAQEHFEKLWGERWILFDLGNVLIPFKHSRISKGLETHLNQLAQQVSLKKNIHSFFFHSEGQDSHNAQLDRGKTDLAKVHREFSKHFKCHISYSKFFDVWCSIFDSPDQNAISCVSKVRKLGMKVGICSNTNHAHWDFLCKRYPKLIKNVDKFFLSFKMKAVKTDPKFFEKIAKLTGHPIEDHLLIDDLDENLTVAKTAGMQVMRVQHSLTYEDVEDVINELHWV